jgi:hypothetical protein
MQEEEIEMSQTQIAAEPSSALQSNALSIERRSARDLSYEEFLREYVRKGKPLVIEGSVPQWAAIQEWTPEFFADRFGEEMVGVTYGVKMPMSELIGKIVASTPEKPGPYLHQLIIHHHLPALLPWLSPENPYGYPRRFCSPLMPKRCRRPDGYLKLLIGGPGGKFPFMHFDSDNANAMITEIYGDKAFVLYPPEDTPYLYPKKDDVNVSQIADLANPDLSQFPLFPKAVPRYTVLKPGETIFIPPKWWHAARVVTTSISVCTNALDSSNWKGFVDWLCRPHPSRKWYVRAVARVYLTLLGVALSIVEGIQTMLPGSSVSRALASLAPLERQQTRLQSGSSVS